MDYRIFLLLALAVALADWLTIEKGWTWRGYITKPGVMVVLIAWVWLATGPSWFVLGLAFSMVGDIFLMIPPKRFIPGMIAFLLAHIAYLVAFDPLRTPWGAPALMMAVQIVIMAVLLFRRLAAGWAANRIGRLRWLIFAYAGVISLMLLSATWVTLRAEWHPGAALLVSLGALSFYASDTLLAYNRFVRPVRHGTLLVRISYHLGQAAMAAGVVLQSTGKF